MKKKFTSTPLVDEHLESLQGMKEAITNDFFYIRLKARMAGHLRGKEKISLRWVFATAAAMLIIFVINVSVWKNVNTRSGQNSSLQKLVQEYGWVSHDLYSNNSN